MKHMMKKLISLSLIASAFASSMLTQANSVTPTLVYRSQGFHSDRQKMVGMVGKTHLADQDGMYGVQDIAVGYLRSFKEDKIAHCLFGDDLICDDCDNKILVQGSDIRNDDGTAATRNDKAWLADYLYLNCQFNGSFTIKPRIQNVVVDLDFYVGTENGMYLRAWGPITWSKWQTRFCSPATDLGSTDSCSTGYMTPTGNEVLLTSIGEYFSGKAPDSTDDIRFQGLKFAKMPQCDKSRTGFADLRVEIGKDIWSDADYHLGVGIQVAAPTGNKRNAEYVMQPVVGNGNHWEIGGTLSGHYVFWKSEDQDKHFGFYMDANLMHQFKNDEQRTFDLKGKDNSRYMLASKMNKLITDNLRVAPPANASEEIVTTAFQASPPSHQFANVYAPVANLTTTSLDVSIGIQADITAMFNYTHNAFSWDFGYNFYGRSCENFKCPVCPDPCNPDNIFNIGNKDTWVLKGDSRSFGFDAEAPVALSGSNSDADIHKGTNANRSTPAENDLNFGVDNAGFAYGNNTTTFNGNRLINTPVSEGGFDIDENHIKSSLNPVFIKSCDVELQKTRGLSHTVFTNLSYNFEYETWSPFIGLGGSAEFGKGGSCKDDCDTSCEPKKEPLCNSCIDCSLSQWAIWVKGGVSFN